MKKLVVSFVIMLVALVLVGCGEVYVSVRQMADGSVIQTVRLNFRDSSTPMIYKVGQIQQHLETYFYQVPFVDRVGEDYYLIEFRFEDNDSFTAFNRIELRPGTIETDRGFFFVEHTLTMQNPLQAFFESEDNRVLNLVKHFNALFDGDVGDVSFVYVMHSNFRRTRVYSDATRSTIGAWHYYFVATGPENIRDIVIFERRANLVNWYLVGLLATALFMGAYYIIAKKRRQVLAERTPTPELH